MGGMQSRSKQGAMLALDMTLMRHDMQAGLCSLMSLLVGAD